MDQLKDVLKQMIKYRFWIAVGISAILPMVAYILGAGPIQTKAAEEEKIITEAANGVKKYAGGTPVNAKYAELVQGKTEELTKDVGVSWEKLYERQAPLLTWPEREQERFTNWGRKWPKDVDPGAVQIAILDYVHDYPEYVTQVYKSFRPFDYVEGTGVVDAPPEAMLLKPSQSMIEQPPPSLGKVWSAQERLWVQRTMLDVVAQVNKNAKNWDTAIVRKIVDLQVANKAAQDQRSIAKGDKLVEAADVVDPNAPPPTTTSSGGGGAPGSSAGGPSGEGSGGAGGADAENPQSVYYIGSPDGAFKILPVMITVQIDQDHIQDFLIALENSPMTIQVRDFEMAKPGPQARVEKPKKGNAPSYAGMYGGPSTFMMPSSGMITFGGAPGMSASMPTSGSNAPSGAPGASGPSSGGMGVTPVERRKGVDVRSKKYQQEREEREKAALAAHGAALHDPYFNIVEVKVYGQARFFNHPPVAPAAATSTAAAAPAPADAAAPAAAPGATPAPAPGAAPAPPAAATTPPAEGAAPAEKKAEEPKADEKKAETPKAEEPKADEKKTDTPKAEEPKADEKKAEPAAPKGV